MIFHGGPLDRWTLPSSITKTGCLNSCEFSSLKAFRQVEQWRLAVFSSLIFGKDFTMLWRNFSRGAAAVAFVTVPVLAIAVLWPGVANLRAAAPSEQTVAGSPAVAEMPEAVKPQDLGNQEADSVTLLDHWQYTARFYRGFGHRDRFVPVLGLLYDPGFGGGFYRHHGPPGPFPRPTSPFNPVTFEIQEIISIISELESILQSLIGLL